MNYYTLALPLLLAAGEIVQAFHGMLHAILRQPSGQGDDFKYQTASLRRTSELDLDAFLSALPRIASSPYAFIGYSLLIAAWTVIGWRVHRNQNLLNALEKLPAKQRLQALQAEMGHIVPPAGLTPEQWLKTRTHQYYFFAFLAFCLCFTSIVVVYFVSKPSVQETPDNIKDRKNSDSDSTISDVITFDSRDFIKKKVSLGNCPNEPCYVIEQGDIQKRSANSNTLGQILYLYGSGFKSQRLSERVCYSCVRFLVRSQDAAVGGRIIFNDKAPEYYWGLRKNLSKIDGIKDIHVAFWIPLWKGHTIEAVNAGRDIFILVEDPSINSIRVKVSISPGTLCTRSEFRRDPGNLEFLSEECKFKAV